MDEILIARKISTLCLKTLGSKNVVPSFTREKMYYRLKKISVLKSILCMGILGIGQLTHFLSGLQFWLS
jgi:hypothetical protein